jgi:hypothetical protein
MALFGLTQKISKIVEWNKLGIQLNKLSDAWLKFEKENPMTHQDAALNAAKHFAYATLVYGAVGAISHFTGVGVLSDFLTTHFGLSFSAVATPILYSGLVFAQNQLKKKIADDAVADATLQKAITPPEVK